MGPAFSLSRRWRPGPGGSDTQANPLGNGSPANSRIIRTFDFEESVGNFDQIPMFWDKVIGRGYPLYTVGKFDNTVFRP